MTKVTTPLKQECVGKCLFGNILCHEYLLSKLLDASFKFHKQNPMDFCASFKFHKDQEGSQNQYSAYSSSNSRAQIRSFHCDLGFSGSTNVKRQLFYFMSWRVISSDYTTTTTTCVHLTLSSKEKIATLRYLNI